MSKKFVEDVISEFLSTSRPEVLCLTGKWGSGKSHTWRQSLKSAVDNDKLAVNDYAYVSLFGLNSLDDLRTAVVESNVKLSKGRPITPSIESVKEVLNRGKEFGIRNTGLVGSTASLLGIKGVQDVATRFQLLTLKRRLVCIDDLERRSKGLSLGDVLGFISHLREERDCKVVLILNDEELKDDKKTFDSYLEKVVETSAAFSPTPGECAQIALLEEPTDTSRQVAQTTEMLGMTNIRVIRRIMRLANKAAYLLKGRDHRLVTHAIKSLCLLGWMQFMPNDAPNKKFVAERYHNLGKEETDKDLDQLEKEKRWYDALSKLDISIDGEFDAALMRGLKDGYFDANSVDHFAEITERALKKSDIESELDSAWQLYKGPLSASAAVVADALEKALKNGAEVLSTSNVDVGISTMRELGFPQRATDLVAYMLEHRPNEKRYFQTTPHRGQRLEDEELRVAFESRIASIGDHRTLLEIVEKGSIFGFGLEDQPRLRSASVADFKSVLLSLKGRDFEDVLRNLLPAKIVAGNNKPVGNNLRDAAEEICQESAINERRLRPLLDVESQQVVPG